MSSNLSHAHAQTALLRPLQVTHNSKNAIKALTFARTAYRAVSLTIGEDGPACFKLSIHKSQGAASKLSALPQYSCVASGCALRCRTHQQGYIPQK